MTRVDKSPEQLDAEAAAPVDYSHLAARIVTHRLASGKIRVLEWPRAERTAGAVAEPGERSDMAKSICSIDDCGRPAESRGWCHTHYEYWRRRGTPVYVAPTLAQRFWEKVDRRGDYECWEWTGNKLPTGYGVLSVHAKPHYTHRLSVELDGRTIPPDMQVDHLCRNTSCVNPLHLEVVTPQQNTRRGISPSAQCARKTHCKRGHPLSGDNLYVWRGRERHCRTCHRERQRTAA